MTSNQSRNQCKQKHRLKRLVCGVDLFCGVGGLTHGLAKGGIRVVAGAMVRTVLEGSSEESYPALKVQSSTKMRLCNG